MENQDIKWETWEEQPQNNNEQPQVNWGEQLQQDQPQINWEGQPQEDIPTWDKQPQEEQSQQIWDKQQSQENIPTWGEQSQQNWEQPSSTEDLSQPSLPSVEGMGVSLNNSPISKKWTTIGNFTRISIDTNVFQLKSDINRVVEDLNELTLTPLGNDGRYDFSPKSDTELGNVIKTLVEISNTQGLKISDCFIYRNQPTESSLNIFKGKPKKHFIFFIQGDYNSGDVVLDLSSIGGPSTKTIDVSPNILTLIPGWVPFRISKNMSDKELITIIGTLN